MEVSPISRFIDERFEVQKLNWLAVVNREPGSEPKGSGSRAHIPTADKGPTVDVTALMVSALQRNIHCPGAYLALPSPPLLYFLLKVKLRWPWFSQKFISCPGRCTFIHSSNRHHGYLPYQALGCVLRKETAVRVCNPMDPRFPAPASASCGTLGSKPSEHLFPQL